MEFQSRDYIHIRMMERNVVTGKGSFGDSERNWVLHDDDCDLMNSAGRRGTTLRSKGDSNSTQSCCRFPFRDKFKTGVSGSGGILGSPVISAESIQENERVFSPVTGTLECIRDCMLTHKKCQRHEVQFPVGTQRCPRSSAVWHRLLFSSLSKLPRNKGGRLSTSPGPCLERWMYSEEQKSRTHLALF